MYTEPMLLVVLLAAVLALSGGPHLSQSMNHASFPRANHKLDSFCHHVRLTEKHIVQIFCLGNHLLHVIIVLISIPIGLTYVTRWYTNTTQWIRGSRQQVILKHRIGVLGMSVCMATGAPKIIMIFLVLFDILQLECHIGQLYLNLVHSNCAFSDW